MGKTRPKWCAQDLLMDDHGGQHLPVLASSFHGKASACRRLWKLNHGLGVATTGVITSVFGMAPVGLAPWRRGTGWDEVGFLFGAAGLPKQRLVATRHWPIVTVEQVIECHVATAAAAAASPVKKAPRVWLLGLKLGGKPRGKTCGKVGVLFCPIFFPYFPIIFPLKMVIFHSTTYNNLCLRWDFPCTSLTVARFFLAPKHAWPSQEEPTG